MKKLLCIALILLISLSLISCKKDEVPEKDKNEEITKIPGDDTDLPGDGTDLPDNEDNDENETTDPEIPVDPNAPINGVTYRGSGDAAYVKSYLGSDPHVDILPEYNGLPVTMISSSAFKGTEGLTSVTIPGSVKSIENSAFHYCTNLESVTLGEGITEIGAFAFAECKKLTELTLPNSLKSIDSSSLGNCDSLKFNEYGNCRYLGTKDNPYFALISTLNRNYESYEIHPDTRIIASTAFVSCSSLTSIEIPDGVFSIGNQAFDFCPSLKSVTISESVTMISSGCFDNAYNPFYNVYDSCYYLGTENNPYYILIEPIDEQKSTYEIHPDTKVIADCAFTGLSELTSIVIPDGVITLGNSTFLNCTSLTSITIPTSVGLVDGIAFAMCEGLTDVYFMGTQEQWEEIVVMYNINSGLKQATIHYNYNPENE